MPQLSADNLRFGSDNHKFILEALIARVKLSEQEMEKYYSRWEQDEKDFAFQIPEKQSDALRRAARDIQGIPQYTTIYVPYSYAMMMTEHTYLASVFLSRSPVFQLSGRHGEPEMNVQANEALLDYGLTVGRQMAPLYVWLHDARKYGLAIIGKYWDKETHQISVIENEPVTFAGVPLEGRFQKVRNVRTVTGYEGNRLFNVRPQDYVPDPRVPLSEVQKGEFCGRKVDIGWNTILKRQRNGQYFNVEAVSKRLKNGSNSRSERMASILNESELPNQSIGGAIHTQTSLVSMLPGIEIIVELIPKEWKLGDEEYPEKWVFTILDRKIIIEARPLGVDFNQFPFNVLDGEIEGYHLVKRSSFDVSRPINNIMSWLFNSHFYSVRKTLNGDVIYDPSRIFESDLLNSDGTGSRIRVKPEAYGEDVRTMVHILTGGTDVTGTHLRDTQVVGELLQRVAGVSDNLMGVLDPGGRKTATEVRNTTSAGITRMKILAEYYSALGFGPLVQDLLQTTRQLYDAPKKFRVAGDLVANPRTFVEVTPDMLAGNYDYVPVDGTLPIDRFAMVNMWTNLFGQLRNMPQIAQAYDLGRVFEWVAQLGGLKNVKQFKIQTVPDGMTVPGAIPMEAGNVAGKGGGPEKGIARGGNGAPVVPLPRQIAGVGPSG